MSNEERAFRERLRQIMLEETQEEMRLRKDFILERALARLRSEEAR